MIKLIEVLNYRCLQYAKQPLQPFNVLVGPNASGKTTFLGVVSFLGKLVTNGPESAISEWTGNFEDLVFGRKGAYFELALEAAIPEERKNKLKRPFDLIRYELRIGKDDISNDVGIITEKAWLKPKASYSHQEIRLLFPNEPNPPATIITGKAATGWQRILTKAAHGNDNFYVEVREPRGGKGWFPSIRLGKKKSALGNLPEDEEKFPVSTWLKSFLVEGIQNIILNSLAIRKASPPGQGKRFRPDGSNLPWVIDDLRQSHPKRFKDWISHIQTALPDIENIRTIERKDDKHRYIVIRYKTGLEVPSWVASDGTLRLLALTIPAFLVDFKGAYLIEEPENGIHPSATETVFQSLSSSYEAQIFIATHSPIILSMASLENLLCFKKTESGSADIVLGTEHPALRNWKGLPNLGTLFASGVLG